MSCSNCTKYKGNCNYHFVDSNGHIDWGCHAEIYSDRYGYCNYYEPKEIEHTFRFKTSADWEPGKTACWTDCPFSFNINLGDSCKCLKTDIKCPFIKE